MTTIYDIAAESGYAPSTVSKVLNNYKGVKATTKKKILAVANDLGFFPNANARSLKAKRSYSVGVLFYLRDSMDLTQYLFINILNAFKREMERRNYDIMLLAKREGAEGGSFVTHCRMRQLDGIVIFGDYTSSLVHEILESDIPAIGFDYMGNKIAGVMSDNYEKMYELTSGLIERGHERILFISGEKNFVTSERCRAFEQALQDMGLPQHYACIEGAYCNPQLCYDLTAKLLREGARPTAIIFSDDYSATGGMNAVQDAGLRIPEDISVAAFDGVVFSEIVRPRLTTVRQDTEEIGKVMALKLIESIERGEKISDVSIVASEVVWADSVKDLRTV